MTCVSNGARNGFLWDLKDAIYHGKVQNNIQGTVIFFYF